jgi:hypothetical protein
MNPFAEPIQALRWVERLSSIGVVISSLELLVFPRPVRDEALMGWRISRLRHRLLVRPPLECLLDALFSYRATLVATAVRLLAATVLALFEPGDRIAAALDWVVALTGIGFTLRTFFGLDGADQLFTITFAGLAIARTVGGPPLASLVLWWLAGHVAVAYFTSGFTKLLSPIWRSGSAIPGVFGTRMYGSPAMDALLARRPALSRVLAHGVVIGEMIFPLCLVVPEPYSYALLACGAAFHAAAAFTMGLNTFFWAFVGTYPALIYAGACLRKLLWA